MLILNYIFQASANDPFGSNSADPFGDSNNDPFGDSGKTDPFDSKPKNDPFGDSGSSRKGTHSDSDTENTNQPKTETRIGSKNLTETQNRIETKNLNKTQRVETKADLDEKPDSDDDLYLV